MENIQENRKIEIGQESLGYLDILGFIGLGIMLIIGLLAGSFMSAFTSKMPVAEGIEGMESVKAAGGIASVFVFIFLLIFAVIYFFPLLYLLRFSKHTKNAVANLDANEMLLGFKNLKSYWKYIGILIIILLAFYFIVLIVAGSSLAFLSGLKG
jgi:heme/copper-type cytochrome/quinol oxidase subunit 2